MIVIKFVHFYTLFKFIGNKYNVVCTTGFQWAEGFSDIDCYCINDQYTSYVENKKGGRYKLMILIYGWVSKSGN